LRTLGIFGAMKCCIGRPGPGSPGFRWFLGGLLVGCLWVCRLPAQPRSLQQVAALYEAGAYAEAEIRLHRQLPRLKEEDIPWAQLYQARLAHAQGYADSSRAQWGALAARCTTATEPCIRAWHEAGVSWQEVQPGRAYGYLRVADSLLACNAEMPLMLRARQAQQYAHACYRVGRPRMALAQAQSALDLYTSIGLPLWERDALYALLVQIQADQGQYEQAAEVFRRRVQALQAAYPADSLTAQPGYATAFIQWAEVELQYAHPQLAFQALQHALAVYVEHPQLDRAVYVAILQRLSTVALVIRQVDLARTYAEQALEGVRQHGLQLAGRMVPLYEGLALACEAQGDTAAARIYTLEAAREAQLHLQGQALAEKILPLGRWLWQRQQLADADALLQAALPPLARALGRHPQLAELYLLQADVAQALGQLPPALAALQLGLAACHARFSPPVPGSLAARCYPNPDATGSLDPLVQLQLLERKARLLAQPGYPATEALQAVQAAGELVRLERLRMDEVGQQRLLAHWQQVLQAGVAAALPLDRPGQVGTYIWQWQQAAQQLQLLDTAWAASLGLAGFAREEEARLRTGYRAARAGYIRTQDSDPARARQLHQAWQLAGAALDSLEHAFYIDFPDYAALKALQPRPGPAVGELWMSYVQAEGAILCHAQLGTRQHAWQVPATPELRRAMDACRQQLQASDQALSYSAYVPFAHQLYQWLVAPGLVGTAGEVLLIRLQVGGQLGTLPFSALVLEPDPRQRWSHTAFLGQRWPLCTQAYHLAPGLRKPLREGPAQLALLDSGLDARALTIPGVELRQQHLGTLAELTELAGRLPRYVWLPLVLSDSARSHLGYQPTRQVGLYWQNRLQLGASLLGGLTLAGATLPAAQLLALGRAGAQAQLASRAGTSGSAAAALFARVVQLHHAGLPMPQAFHQAQQFFFRQQPQPTRWAHTWLFMAY
jgi:hypothetical protein